MALYVRWCKIISKYQKKIVQKKQPKISVSSNSNLNVDYIKELNKLIDDLESGKITQKEFNTKKNKILKWY